jgi:hypothetical protein
MCNANAQLPVYLSTSAIESTSILRCTPRNAIKPNGQNSNPCQWPTSPQAVNKTSEVLKSPINPTWPPFNFRLLSPDKEKKRDFILQTMPELKMDVKC